MLDYGKITYEASAVMCHIVSFHCTLPQTRSRMMLHYEKGIGSHPWNSGADPSILSIKR